jgi:hypothetical protein
MFRFAKEGKMDYDHERALRLLNKASTCLGMIAEVKANALLMKGRLKKAQANGLLPEAIADEVIASHHQMKRQLAKYSRKLKRIYEELDSYGVFSDMA